MTSYFKRYTDLPALIHILCTQSVVLLNPQTWDDKNDSFFMAEYKERKDAKTLLALCFSEASETYHHWRVFSHGSHGVCIEFDKKKFLNQFKIDTHIKHGRVKYETRETFTSPATIDLESIPFLKRYAYRDEKEYRVIYSNLNRELLTKSYAISLNWIERITLSPWMAPAMLESVENTLRSIKGCVDLPIARSTLVNSERWKELVIAALDR